VIKKIKNYITPHTGNDHKPEILHEESILAILFISVLLFSFSIVGNVVIDRVGTLAAVYSGVLVDLTNDSRQDYSLTTLKVNSTLEQAAFEKAKHMAENQYFSHNSPNGTTPWYWFDLVGYEFAYAGENLAVHFGESEDVVSAWLESPTHKANILNNDFTEIGIATYEGEYEGYPTTYVVQLFGTPLYKKSGVVASSQASSEVTALVTVAEEKPEPTPASTVPTVTNVEKVEEAETFISVKNVEVEDVASVEAAASVVDEKSDQKSTPSRTYDIQRLIQPSGVASLILYVFAFVVFIAMILMMTIEVRKQHLAHVAYGALLLIILGTLSHINLVVLSYL